jgi:hypothetical protein
MTSGAAVLMALLVQSAESPVAPLEAPATKVRLDLRAAGECVSRAELTSRVAARSRRIQFVDDASIYARVSLTSARPGGVVAELVLAVPGPEPPSRRFAARSCAEVTDAIALIIAVTLDPTVKLGEAGASAVPVPAEAPAAPPAAARPAPSPVAAQSAAPAPSGGTARQFGVTVAGQTIIGATPGVMPGIALYGMAAVERDGPWAPALFVGATHVWRSDLPESEGNASFTLDAASLDACPLRLERARFVARPCASALVGRLKASGSDTDQATSAARPFGSAGVAFMASFGSRIEVSARLAVGLTLLRDAYELGRVIFYRASPITVGAGLGVGFRWP